MKKSEKYFVRIDEMQDKMELNQSIYEKHMKYLKEISSERYFLGGGFNNIKGGMIIFTAKDINEARMIAEKDPLFENTAYKYELYEWEIIISSNLKINPFE